MGTWSMGGKYERDPSNYKESIEALKYGLELGFRLIDTAELYGQGLCEEIVGQAIKGFKREKIFIITKVWKDNLEYEAVIKAAKNSLKRLDTTYIDLYLIHWSTENPLTKKMPLSQTMRALEYLVDKKIVKYIGVSNASVEMLKQAQKHLDHTGLKANQIEYNLNNRFAEKDVIPYCEKNNVKIIAHRPLAKGNLRAGDNKIIQLLSQKYEKTPTQVALNWIISKGHVPIPMAMNKEHIKENYGAAGWKLEKNDIELINNI